MHCREVQNRLIDYLEDPFGDEARQMAEHIGTCEECRKEYRTLRETIRLVQEVKWKDPGADFWTDQRERIRAAVSALEESDQTAHGILRRWMRWRPQPGRLAYLTGYQLAGIIMILLLALSSVIYVGRNPFPRHPGSSSLAQDEEVLDEIYLSGTISGGSTPIEELGRLTDQELELAWQWMAEEFDPFLEQWDDGLPSIEGSGFDLEAEIGRLDRIEMRTLLEILERAPATG